LTFADIRRPSEIYWRAIGLVAVKKIATQEAVQQEGFLF
jgi:hypothetical protein